MALLAELEADKLPKAPETAGLRFADVLARLLGREPRRQEPARRPAGQADMRRSAAALLAAVLAATVPAVAHAAAAHAHAAAAAGLESRPLVLILAMAALSLIPFALLMVTSFVRISVVLSILRSAIGTPSVPPTQVLTGLALVLTIAVMAPTGQRMYDAMKPALGMAAGADVASARDGRGAGHGRRPRQGAAARLHPQAHRCRATARRSSP